MGLRSSPGCTLLGLTWSSGVRLDSQLELGPRSRHGSSPRPNPTIPNRIATRMNSGQPPKFHSTPCRSSFPTTAPTCCPPLLVTRNSNLSLPPLLSDFPSAHYLMRPFSLRPPDQKPLRSPLCGSLSNPILPVPLTMKLRTCDGLALCPASLSAHCGFLNTTRYFSGVQPPTFSRAHTTVLYRYGNHPIASTLTRCYLCCNLLYIVFCEPRSSSRVPPRPCALVLGYIWRANIAPSSVVLFFVRSFVLPFVLFFFFPVISTGSYPTDCNPSRIHRPDSPPAWRCDSAGDLLQSLCTLAVPVCKWRVTHSGRFSFLRRDSLLQPSFFSISI